MIRKLKTKEEIRAEIENATTAFIQSGGEVNKVDQGISGRDINANLNQTIPFSQEEKTTRTLLTETVKAIDERKSKKKPTKPQPQTPKKRIIYDDFGEPIREVWDD